MDQIAGTLRADPPPPIEAALALDSRRRRRSWPVVVAALLLIGAGAGLYLWIGRTPEAPAFATVAAERRDLTVRVSATGTLQPLTQVDISSELSGVMRSVAVEENQRVKAGDVLAELDKTRIGAQVERSEASVQAAEARVADARTTLLETEQALARTERLTGSGMAPAQALEAATAAKDRAASAVASAEANLAVARAELKLQRADFARSTIYAPIDGVVLTRSVDPGQTVASSLQAPVLFVIAADLERMELKAAIDEADIGAVASGQKASFTVDAFPGRSFDAAIRDIAYAAVTTDGVVTYDARLDVDNRELLLRPGMTATVEIVTREASDVLAVPASAFRFRPPAAEPRRSFSLQSLFMPRLGRNGGSAAPPPAADGSRTLYVLRDGEPVAARVRTGSSDGDWTEVLSGVSEGDPVVVGTAPASR